MPEAPAVITGWDLGDGGGARTLWLPREPAPMVLAEAKLNFVGGEAAKLAAFDLWGLDPRLTVAISFGRIPNPSLALTGAASNVTTNPPAGPDGIKAYSLAKMARDELIISEIDAGELFSNGGVVSFGWGDGCELATAAEGVRFEVPLIRNNDNSYDFAVNLIVRPNQPLGCRELAIELARHLVVRNLTRIIWDGAP